MSSTAVLDGYRDLPEHGDRSGDAMGNLRWRDQNRQVRVIDGPRTRENGRAETCPEAPDLEGLQQMSGAVAHLFSSLLNGIGLSTDCLRSAFPDGSINHLHLDVIDQAWKRGSEVCRRLWLASGEMPFAAAELDLNEVVRQAKPIASTLANGVRLRIDLESERLPLTGDATMIRQLLFELTANAREAIGEGPGQITISTSRRTRTAFDRRWAGGRQLSEPEVVLEVSDDGCGLQPEMEARIFDPFFTTKSLGRGLGLTAAFSIVEKHRGTIQVDSREGRGTSFQVVLPAAPSS